jgi:hypothetical protein
MRIPVMAQLALASSAARPKATAPKHTTWPAQMPAVPAIAPRVPWRAPCDITKNTAGPGDNATSVHVAR